MTKNKRSALADLFLWKGVPEAASHVRKMYGFLDIK